MGGSPSIGWPQELHSDTDALGRLLDACVGLGLLDRSGTEYANTPLASTYLCRHSPKRLTGYVGYSNDVLWKLWAHLEDAIREGSHRWKQAYGWEGPIFKHIFRSDDAKREFLMGMHGFGVISSPQVVAAFDLSRFRHLVDLGGASGHLAIAACQRYRDPGGDHLRSSRCGPPGQGNGRQLSRRGADHDPRRVTFSLTPCLRPTFLPSVASCTIGRRTRF